jgi:hypothetical protein
LVEMLEIYVLNLAITLFLFIILTFRAWIELKNYRIMWKELERRKTREVARAQNSVFCRRTETTRFQHCGNAQVLNTTGIPCINQAKPIAIPMTVESALKSCWRNRGKANNSAKLNPKHPFMSCRSLGTKALGTL